jgi:hypothetical protein
MKIKNLEEALICFKENAIIHGECTQNGNLQTGKSGTPDEPVEQRPERDACYFALWWSGKHPAQCQPQEC